jgi:hypothetical protein
MDTFDLAQLIAQAGGERRHIRRIPHRAMIAGNVVH